MKKLTKIIGAGTFLLSSLFPQGAFTEEQTDIDEIQIPTTIDETIQDEKPADNPWETPIEFELYENEGKINHTIEFNFNYKPFQVNPRNYEERHLSELNRDEILRINEAYINIKTGRISDYDSLIGELENLSPRDQENILSAFANLLYGYNYGSNKSHSEFSQEDLFNLLHQDLLNHDKDNDNIGVCKQISLAISRMQEDLGNSSAVVTSIASNYRGHAYSVTQTGEGIVITNGYKTLTYNSRNVEEAIRAHQSNSINTLLFRSHFFGTDGNLRYRLIFDEGEDFLNFVGHDITTRSLEEKLVRGNEDIGRDFIFNFGNIENSSEIVDIYEENPLDLSVKGGIS